MENVLFVVWKLADEAAACHGVMTLIDGRCHGLSVGVSSV